MDRFDEQARRLEEAGYACDADAIAAALREAWDAAIEEAARVVERTATNPWVAVRSLKSTPPRTNEKGDHERD